MAEWQAIETEYITTDTSYRKLAKKYGVSYQAICHRSQTEDWRGRRDQYRNKTVSKAVARIGNKQARKIVQINNLTDRLLKKLEKAIDELDLQLCKHTDRTKVIEYNNTERPDKPTKEIIHEEEKLLEIKSIIDRQGLKQIASALKDIKEIKMLQSNLDKQEQQARIDKLRAEAAKGDKDTGGGLTVTLEGLVGEYGE